MKKVVIDWARRPLSWVKSSRRSTGTRTKVWALIVSSLLLAVGSVGLSVPESYAATSAWIFDSKQTSPPTDPDTAPVELGIRFVPKTSGTITAIRFYKPSQSRGPFTASLWDHGGRVITKIAVSPVTATGWQTVVLPKGVSVTAGRQYTASYSAPRGRYAATEKYFSTATETAYLKFPQAAGVYKYQTGSFPTDSYRDSNYYVDVEFKPSVQVTPTPTSTTTPTPTATSIPLPSSETGLPKSVFPMLVWLQAPSDGWGDDWANIGVNGFYGLWRWPDDADKYPGWASNTIEELQKNNQYAYAGESADAVRRTLQMSGNDRIVGWLAGDEPDMFGPNPQEWTKRINAMRAIQDRPVAANFGLGFGGFDWWYDHISDADRAAWCASVDVPSVDYYGMTSPNNPSNQNGAWTYGRAIDNLRKACGDHKPLGIFVETAEITTGAKTASPADIKASAWNGIIHGADHVNLFVHDFDCTNGECGPMAFMTTAKYAPQRQAVKELADELNKWNAVLRTSDVKGAQAATVAGIPLHTLTKRHGGKTYVFAQSAGDSSRIEGYSGTATVKVAGKSFTDQWSPNQVRVYVVE